MTMVTTPSPADELLAEARQILETRRASRGLPPVDQTARITELARGLALSRSPVGRLAAAAHDAFERLLEALDALGQAVADDDAAAEAGRQALEDAGLAGPADDGHDEYQAGYFVGTAAEVGAARAMVVAARFEIGLCGTDGLTSVGRGPAAV